MWSGYSEKGTGSQERGPASFALEAPGVQQAQQAGTSAAPVRASFDADGGRATGNVVVPSSAPDPTMVALLKLGDSIIQPELEKIRTGKFLKGMQQAASGAAMTDIINSQPWYNQLFGDGAAVEGARAYTASAKSATWSEAQLRAMPELRKQSPDAIPQYLMQSIQAVSTGDPTTDVQLQGELMKLVPGLIRAHTKEHVKWQQEEATTARRAAWRAHAGVIQRYSQLETASPEDRDGAAINMLSAIVPSQGENPEAFEKEFADFTVELATQGNWPALQNLVRGGVMAQMDGRTQQIVNSQMEKTAREQIDKALPSVAEDFWKVATNQTLTPQERIDELEVLNARVAFRSGVPPEIAVAFDPRTIMRTVTQGLDAQASAAEREVNAASRAAAQRANAQAIDAALTSFIFTDHQGQGSQEWVRLRANMGVTEAQLNDKIAQTWGKLDGPTQAALVKNFPNERFPIAKAWAADLWSTVTQPNIDAKAGVPAMNKLASMYRALEGNEALQGAYFSDRQMKELSAYVAALDASTPPEAAFQQVRMMGPIYEAAESVPKSAWDKTIAKKVEQTFDTWQAYNPFIAKGKYNLPDDQVAIMRGVMAMVPHTVGTTEGRADIAMARATDPNNPYIEIAGNYVVINSNPAIRRPAYAKEFGDTTFAEEVNPVVGDLIADRVDRHGLSSVRVIRNGADLFVYGDKEGKSLHFQITRSEVDSALVESRKRQLAPQPKPEPVRSGVARKGNPVQQMLRNNAEGTPLN